MVFAVICIVSFVIQNLCCKEYGSRFPDTIAAQSAMIVVSASIMTAIMAMVSGVRFLNGGEWIISVSFGFWFVVTLASMTLAMNYGHMGITLLIQNASLIVPTLYSLIVWRERLTAAKAVGIFFVPTMLALSTKDGSASADEKTQRRWNRRLWVIFTLLAFVGDSLLSVLQGSMAMSQTDPVVFTFWTSAFSAGFAALLFIAANHGRGNALPSIKANAKAFWLLCAGRFLTRPQPAQTPACP